MKLIFLDIEGVLVTPKSQQHFDKMTVGIPASTLQHAEYAKFLRKAIEYLNILVEKTDAKIVIISQWRRTISIAKIIKMLNDAGIYAARRVLLTYNWFCGEDQWRSDEIEDFLVSFSMSENGDIVVPKYVIIDASKDYQDYQLPNLVSPDPEKGFNSEDLKKAINILERAS